MTVALLLLNDYVFNFYFVAFLSENPLEEGEEKLQDFCSIAK